MVQVLESRAYLPYTTPIRLESRAIWKGVICRIPKESLHLIFPILMVVEIHISDIVAHVHPDPFKSLLAYTESLGE